MPWGGIISAAGSIGGSLLSHYSAKSINEDNMAFQREVAQNGVRWKVADMKAAGLNPLLASGINATAPAGGSSAMPDYSGIGASARDIGRMVAEKTSRIASANAAKASADANNAIKTGQLLDKQKENVQADTVTKLANSAASVRNLNANSEKAYAEQLLTLAKDSRQVFENRWLKEALTHMDPDDRARLTRLKYSPSEYAWAQVINQILTPRIREGYTPSGDVDTYTGRTEVRGGKSRR